MAAITVDEIYERYIKPLPPEERMYLLAKIAEDLAQQPEQIAERPKRSLLELEGLGAEIWEGVDAQSM